MNLLNGITDIIKTYADIKKDLKQNSKNLLTIKEEFKENVESKTNMIISQLIDSIVLKDNEIIGKLDKLSDLTIKHDDKLNKKINKLEDRLNKIELNNLKKQLNIAVNDVWDICKLDEIKDEYLDQDMRNIKYSRDGECHYIRTKYEPDSEKMKQYKMKLIKDKLLKYNELKGKYLFPNILLNILSDKIKDLNVDELNENDKQTADNWWDDI